MINFNCLFHAISYRYHCPLCKYGMKVEPGCIEWETHDSYNYARGSDFYYPGMDNNRNCSRTLIKFGYGESSIIVDYDTGEVTSVKRTITDTYGSSYGSYGSMTGVPGAGSYTGLSDYNIFPLNMICSHCLAYRYTIQVHISLHDMRVVNLCLNSESLIFKDKKGLHIIRNAYSTEKTEYHFRDAEGKDININSVDTEICLGFFTHATKTMELPLIPMNMEEPTKTLERVKTLVLFS